ncbi:MAG: AAA family ATPase [Lachnospiraceae bacterium]|nr:AAA family ATPase [Lachnospiraceae bacterium]
MIERISFEHFLGFDKLELQDMKPITLISGKNNAGKSFILEGIFLF